MKQIKTKDGSVTCYSDKFKESYHSVSGAKEEAFKKYIEPCGIKDGFKILDICFGLGYNTAAAIENFKDLKIVCLEFDKNIISEIENININFKKWNIIKKLAKDLKYKDSNYNLKLIIGDARKTIKKLAVGIKKSNKSSENSNQDYELFDAVFLDPFSTMKNPELWTVEFFEEIRKRMKPDAILSTYSSSAIVREGLIEAGFKIGNGPCIGRYRPCTLAAVGFRPGKELDAEDNKLLNAFGKPFHDMGLWDKEKIIKYRERLKDI